MKIINGVIYKIENKDTHKVYIGLTINDLESRIYQHSKSYKSYISKAINKHGIHSFDVSIIDGADNITTLRNKEKHWIQHYNCKVPNGYNLTDGGEGVCGYIYSEEQRKQMSKRCSGENNPNYGKKHSEETLSLISKALKGREIGLGQRREQSSFMKGNKNLQGKTWKLSEEAKRHHSESMILAWVRRKSEIGGSECHQ